MLHLIFCFASIKWKQNLLCKRNSTLSGFDIFEQALGVIFYFILFIEFIELYICLCFPPFVLINVLPCQINLFRVYPILHFDLHLFSYLIADVNKQLNHNRQLVSLSRSYCCHILLISLYLQLSMIWWHSSNETHWNYFQEISSLSHGVFCFCLYESHARTTV